MLDPSTVTGSANPSEDSTAWTAVIPTTTASGLPVTPRGRATVSVVTQQEIIAADRR